MARSYSPYDLDTFQRCPQLFDFQRRWRVPDDGQWPISLHLGAAVAAGLSMLRRGKGLDEALRVASQALRYQNNEEWTLEGVMKHVRGAIEVGMTSDLGLKTIISADKRTYGHCRPDVVGRTEAGELRVVDDKTKLRLDERYLNDTLSEFKDSNQLYTGAWEVSQYYNEPVTSVGINLIVCLPKPWVKFYPIVLTPEGVERWARGAAMDYLDMENIESGAFVPRTQFTGCRSKFNKPGTTEKQLCEMYRLCREMNGDESRATTWYERKGG